MGHIHEYLKQNIFMVAHLEISYIRLIDEYSKSSWKYPFPVLEWNFRGWLLNECVLFPENQVP